MRADLAAAEDRYQRLIRAVTDYVFIVEVEGGHAVRTTHGPNCVAVTVTSEPGRGTTFRVLLPIRT